MPLIEILSKSVLHFDSSICAAILSRQGAGALCDGSQQVSDSGFGIPDDETQLICGGCY